MSDTEQVYFHDWAESGRAGMASDFAIDEALELAGATVLYAEYTYEDYSGSAHVVFERDGKLYEVFGSHCSCYGLEGQWTPEETTAEAILMRPTIPDALRARLSVRTPTGRRAPSEEK